MSLSRKFLTSVCVAGLLAFAAPASAQDRFVIKFEKTAGGACSGDIDANETTVAGAWQTLTWNISTTDPACDKLVILPHLGTLDDPPGRTYSMDKLEYPGQSGPVSITFDEVSPPYTVPVGCFEGASCTLAAPDPVDPGPGQDGGNALNILRSGGQVFALALLEPLPPLLNDGSPLTISARIYMPPAPVVAGLMPYTQDFEALALAQPAPGNTALGDDGWKLFTNVFEADGTTFLYSYNNPPDPAPNQSGPGAAFSNIVTGQGGPDQGDNQLVIFNDYNNGDHNIGRRIESNVFQEQTIGASDVGKTFRVIFNAKKGDIAGATTANAFIKTLDPNAGFAVTNFPTIDTTNLPVSWDTYGIYLPIDAGLVGQILQFGFSSTASNFDPSGVVYDNINFGMAPCDGNLLLTGTIAPGAYGGEISATLKEAVANQGDGISVQAPKVTFDTFNAGVAVGGSFSASNGTCAPVPDNLAANGDFETGDFTGWAQFPSGESQQTVSTDNPHTGTYAGRLNNDVKPSASLIKQANVGIGTVTPGQTVYISFWARGTLADGGVAFAEFFSELSGGGTSSNEILGGGPLALDPDPATWKLFTFSPVTGADVSGGVTLQLTATTGGAPTSTADMFYDDACISVVPGVCFPAGP